jgi:quercetin dioxygenase-like cupin family protein
LSEIAAAASSGTSIPADDPARQLSVSDPDGPRMQHISLAGGAYTILLTGEQTGGRYCLIDMVVPPGGGPPPHRHDFEEMFTILEGEIELVFRGETHKAAAGATVNIPANAPHAFKNKSAQPAHLLCMCSPPGQEHYFMAVGDLIESRVAPPPKLSQAEQAERRERAKALAAKYRTEFVS